MSAHVIRQGLYPIIRRVRRPLVVLDEGAGRVAVAVPLVEAPPPPVPVVRAEKAATPALERPAQKEKRAKAGKREGKA